MTDPKSPQVMLPREPTEAMILAAIHAGQGLSRSGRRPTLGDVIRAEYAAMIAAAEQDAAARGDAELNGPDRW